jgi:hypothetical protein
LVFVAGCALGRVTTPSGQEVVGFAVGNSFLESCLTPPPSDIGPEPRECATLKASTVTSLGEILGAAISGAVVYFTGGF